MLVFYIESIGATLWLKQCLIKNEKKNFRGYKLGKVHVGTE